MPLSYFSYHLPTSSLSDYAHLFLYTNVIDIMVFTKRHVTSMPFVKNKYVAREGLG